MLTMKKRRIIFVLGCLVLILGVAREAYCADKKKKAQPPEKKEPVAEAEEKTGSRVYTPVYKNPVPKIPKYSVPKVPNYARPGALEDVARIQRELQDIIRIHQSLQFEQQRENREIQRIREQTQIHKQLLNNLAAAPSPPGPTSPEEALRAEKIRLIDEEAQKNRNTIEKIQGKQKEATQEKPVKVSSPPASSKKDKKKSAR